MGLTMVHKSGLKREQVMKNLRVLVVALFVPLGFAQDAQPDTQRVEHAFGVSEVPVSPERIVSADLGAFIPTIGVLAALEVKPLAATVGVIPGYLEGFLEGVEVIRGEPNFETITALNPDLIITPGVAYNQETYETLTQIAPTAAPDWYWQTLDQVTGYWTAVASLVGRDAEGERLVSDLGTRIATLREKYAGPMAGKPVSVFQVQGPGLSGLYLQTGRLESALLDAVGLERPANQTYSPEGDWYETLSTERLDEADAWAIFVEVYADDPADIPAIRAELEANPLWQSLEAVQAGRVFFVPTERWSGTDPFVAKAILDEVDANLSAALAND